MTRYRFAMLATVSATAIALSGCQSLLSDIQACERHYDGTVSGGTLTPAVLAGSAKVDCCPTGTMANATHNGCVPIASVTVGAPIASSAPTS